MILGGWLATRYPETLDGMRSSFMLIETLHDICSNAWSQVGVYHARMHRLRAHTCRNLVSSGRTEATPPKI